MLTDKKSAVVVHGILKESFFDALAEKGIEEVIVLEGRPRLQGMQHSCGELLKRKIKPIVITDSSAGLLFFKDFVKEVWISYQVTDKEGALCFIGALPLGVLGRKHKVSVNLYPALKRYEFIGKEEETLSFNGERTAPEGVGAYTPLMEWLPRKYITKVYE